MREAFWNVYAPGCSEHYLLHIMRSSPQFIPELAWVATEANHLVGAIYAMRGQVESDLGAMYDVLTLGPIGVQPSHQRHGVGRSLIEQMCHEATRMGHRTIVLCGDPAFFPKSAFFLLSALGFAQHKTLICLHSKCDHFLRTLWTTSLVATSKTPSTTWMPRPLNTLITRFRRKCVSVAHPPNSAYLNSWLRKNRRFKK